MRSSIKGRTTGIRDHCLASTNTPKLRDTSPTGPHEAVAGSLAGRIYAEILRLNLKWLIPKNCLIKPPAIEATALRPDVIVLDKEELSADRARFLITSKTTKGINIAAGCVMISVGVFLVIKA